MLLKWHAAGTKGNVLCRDDCGTFHGSGWCNYIHEEFYDIYRCMVKRNGNAEDRFAVTIDFTNVASYSGILASVVFT